MDQPLRQLDSQPCPACAFTLLARAPPPPEPGDIAVCGQCAAYLAVGEDGALRRATIEEIFAVQESPQWRDVFHLRHQIMTHRAQEHTAAVKINFEHEA
jgi:hypothetical protein